MSVQSFQCNRTGERNARRAERPDDALHRRIVAGTLLLALHLPLAFADTLNADSHIEKVTVYPDRALVYRAASQQIPAGEHELIFTNLPSGLDENSLQFNANASGAGVQILHVSSTPDLRHTSASTGVNEVAEQIDVLKQQIARLEDQIKVDDNQISFIRNYQNGHSVQIRDVPPLSQDAFIGLMAFTGEHLVKAMQTRRGHIQEKEQLLARLNVLTQRKEQLAQSDENEARKVVVTLRAAEPATIDSVLSYVVAGAAWSPVYDARYDSTTGKLSLNYFGQISQDTSEDWSNVAITLSTAQPVTGVSLPQLQPWRVDVAAAPAPAPRSQMRARQFESAMASGAAPAMEMADAASYVPANSQTSATNTTFEVPGRQTIKTGGQQQRVPLTTLTETAELSYELVPSEAPAVFATVKMTNGKDFPLLAGNVNAFFDNEFIAASDMKTVFPKEQLELAMGVDQAISVKREPLQRFTESTGLTGSGTRLTYEYKTVIRNNRKQPVQLILHDRFPVSGDEKIDIKRLEPTGSGIALKGDGRFEQKLTLEAGEEHTALLKFSVQYPKSLDVSGLP
ncbi:MAG TPA: mucoidy inhibitor MuiA family protein [Advenella sp.]|nr:mucoidy inhibitor MuiA family protein [Advenella sp.]